MAITSNNAYMNSNEAYTIDTFLANKLTSTSITAKHIRSKLVKVNNLTLDGNLRHLNIDENNYNFDSVQINSDDPWKQSWEVHNKAFNIDHRETGAILSSGKIAVFTSFDNLDVQKTEIAVKLQYSNGTYTSNTIEPFYVNRIKLFNNEDIDIRTIVKKQELDLKSSIMSSDMKLINKLTGDYALVNSDIFVPRHLPFSIMQNVLLKKGNIDIFPMYHEVYTKQNLRNVSFNNNTIYDKHIQEGIYVLSGEGYTEDNKKVAFASCYSFNHPEKIKNLGFNVYRNDTHRCFNTFNIDLSSSDIQVNIFSCILTEYDFPEPLIEVKKMVMTIFASGMTPIMSMQKIRSQHVNTWNSIWQTNIILNPKTGISDEKEQELVYLNKIIKTALYNIFSISRESNKLDLTNTTHAIIDRDGTLMNNSDIWIIPIMLLIKPEIAKSMLEFRFQSLGKAQQIATNYGYQGAQFPFTHEQTNSSWNTNSPMFVFNNALIAINTWNYYRATQDKTWLQETGYNVLKNVSDFLISVTDYNPDTNMYCLKNAISLNGSHSKKNNTFTNNMVKLALAFTIEASYELVYNVKEEWEDVYYNLPLLYLEGSRDILKYDTHSIEEDTYYILELFFILTPYYSRVYFSFDDQTGLIHNTQSIKKNIDYYINKVKTRYKKHPYNLGLLTILYGLYTQYDESYVSQYEDSLKNFTSQYVSGIWKNMKGFMTSSSNNSIDMNCIFLHMLMQGIVELKLKGGVSETRFYYEELKVKGNKSANMPNHWQSIKLTKFGAKKETNTTTNNLLYIANSN